MTKNDFKAVTRKWLSLKGFKKGPEIYNLYPFEDFDLSVAFYKDRFDEVFYIDVGFFLKDEPKPGNTMPTTWAFLRTIIRNNLYHYRYEEWEEAEYLKCLEEIYEIYLKPYFEMGIEMPKLIAKDPTCGGKYGATKEFPYRIHPDAKKKLLNM